MKNNVLDLLVSLLVDDEFLENIKKGEHDYVSSSNSEFTDWDVKKNDPIEYFDSTLSYELTGYRPVNETQGLDFDPNWFTEAKQCKINTGLYCPYKEGTKKHIDFWKEQYRLCNEGMTKNGYTITGDNYFFLNFYRLKDVQVNTAGGGRLVGFPNFFSKQYEYFHYIDLCRKTGHDVIALKARGVGFSEIAASLGVRLYTTVKNAKVVYTAYSNNYLEKLLDKCWTLLEFLNADTENGMKHLRQKYNSDTHKRASLLNKDREEYGWMSDIQGIVADEPRKLRGDRVDLLFFEECFGRDMEVIMSDHTHKKILDIEVGDQVLGIDGKPRTVIHTNTGVDFLYPVMVKNKEIYKATGNHPIPYIEVSDYNMDYYKPTLRTVDGSMYPGFGRVYKPLLLEGEGEIEDLDPYLFGCWLGGGYTNTPYIAYLYRVRKTEYNKDRYLNPAFCYIDKNYDVRLLKEDSPDLNFDYLEVESFTKALNKYNLIGNPHISLEILRCSADYRRKILAGFLDITARLEEVYGELRKIYIVQIVNYKLLDMLILLLLTLGITIKSHSAILSRYKRRNKHITYKYKEYSLTGNIANLPVLRPELKLEHNRIVTDFPRLRISKKDVVYDQYFGITLEETGDEETDGYFMIDDYVIVHNCGSFLGLIKTYLQSNALVEILGVRFGVRFVWGTGGDAGPALEGLATMFNNPKGYNGLPYKHNYTKSGETVYTGFFIPAFTFVSGPGYIDNRGVTNIAKAKEYYENKRRQLLNNPKNYIIECAEYCFNPEDALALEGDNIFNTEILADQLSQIRIYKNGPKPQAGVLEYSFKNNVHKEENIDKVIFRPKASGKVLVLEEPIVDKDGNVPRNLYVAGIDGIDLGQEDTSEATNDPSKFAVVVMRRQQGLKEPTIVCIYKDRPRTLKEAHLTCLKILQWYNCKAVLEATRVSLLAFFRERHLENRYLFRRPKMTQSDIQRGQSKQFGAPASETVIKHLLELIANYIDEFGLNIWFEDVLEELLKYSYLNKGKFDLVAAIGQMLLGNEELMDIKPQDVESSNNVFPLLGYWKDEDGIRHYGVVPNRDELKGNIKVGWNNDYDGPRTSNPRYHIGNL